MMTKSYFKGASTPGDSAIMMQNDMAVRQNALKGGRKTRLKRKRRFSKKRRTKKKKQKHKKGGNKIEAPQSHMLYQDQNPPGQTIHSQQAQLTQLQLQNNAWRKYD